METIDTPILINKISNHSKEYDLQINDDNFKLKIDVYSNQKINFHIKQTNKISKYYYENEYTYDEITKALKLLKEHYTDIIKVFNFYNTAITMKKVLLKEEKEKKQLILNMERELDFDLIQCNLELKEKKINNDEMIRIIIEEINEIKNKKTENEEKNKEKEIQNNEERIIKLEEKINKIENEREIEKEEINQIKIKMENEKNELKNEIKNLNEEINKMNIIIENNKNELRNEIINSKEEIQILNAIIESNNKYIEDLKNEQNRIIEEQKKKEEQKIKEQEELKNKIYILLKYNPCNLKYREDITNNNSCIGLLYNFAVYKGFKDNKEYIVYNNKNNYNIEVMRINDKAIITSLKGHNI